MPRPKINYVYIQNKLTHVLGSGLKKRHICDEIET